MTAHPVEALSCDVAEAAVAARDEDVAGGDSIYTWTSDDIVEPLVEHQQAYCQQTPAPAATVHAQHCSAVATPFVYESLSLNLLSIFMF